MRFRGKTILVTGASSGIGRSIARQLAVEGATVALCSRNLDNLRNTLDSLVPRSPSHRVFPLDVSDGPAIRQTVDEVIKAYGHIDALVSNAGAVTRASILELTLDDWDSIYDVNVRGPFVLTQSVALHMAAQGDGGAILFVASNCGRIPWPRMAHYASSKAALIHFARCAALELGAQRIRVNVVCPGPTDTGFGGAKVDHADVVRRHHIVTGRIATPEDVAEAALFLLSPAADQITGQAVNVDGGEAMC